METWGIVRLLSEMMEVSSRCNVMKTQSGNRLELARGLNLDLRDRMASETSPLPPISLNVEEDGRLDRKGHDIGRRDLSAKKEESDQRRHAGDNNGFEPESCKTEALLSGSHRVGRTSWDLWIVMFLALVSATVITGWNGTNNLAEAPLQQLEVVSCSGLPSWLAKALPRFIQLPSHAEFAAASLTYFLSTTWYSYRLQDERYREVVIAIILLLSVGSSLCIRLDLQSIIFSVVSWIVVVAFIASTIMHTTFKL